MACVEGLLVLNVLLLLPLFFVCVCVCVCVPKKRVSLCVVAVTVRVNMAYVLFLCTAEIIFTEISIAHSDRVDVP